MTRFQILLQMFNEDFKEKKASQQKDPRAKVYQKLKSWVQSSVEYKSLTVQPYILKEEDFEHERFGETLMQVK